MKKRYETKILCFDHPPLDTTLEYNFHVEGFIVGDSALVEGGFQFVVKFCIGIHYSTHHGNKFSYQKVQKKNGGRCLNHGQI